MFFFTKFNTIGHIIVLNFYQILFKINNKQRENTGCSGWMVIVKQNIPSVEGDHKQNVPL